MSTSVSKPVNLNIWALRSVADSIEPAFPSAADLLRGIAREMDEGLIVTAEQISAAFSAHASADDWGVPAFYEGGLLVALRGEYDQPDPTSPSEEEA